MLVPCSYSQTLWLCGFNCTSNSGNVRLRFYTVISLLCTAAYFAMRPADMNIKQSLSLTTYRQHALDSSLNCLNILNKTKHKSNLKVSILTLYKSIIIWMLHANYVTVLLSNYLVAIKQLRKQPYLKLKSASGSNRYLLGSVCSSINVMRTTANSILFEPTNMVSLKT